MLGLLLPVTAALAVALIVLAAKRRDWREPLQMLLPIAIFAVVGFLLVMRVVPPAPGPDFWLALSIQIGALAFFTSVCQFLHLVWKRLRRDREALEAVSAPLEVSDGEETVRQEPGPRSRLLGIEAEYYVAEWMRYLGAIEAVVTPARRDGGVDVRSQYYVAQVKHRPGDFVSVESLRALIGVASLERRTPLFFASGNYSRYCLPLAAEAGAALFFFKPRDGRLVAANPLAQRLLDGGLRGAGAAAPAPVPTESVGIRAAAQPR
jgi:Restriction endonuclease